MDMIEPVVATPISIYTLGVAQSISCAAAGVGDEYGETIEGEELDEGHREPGEVRPLLSLWAAVDVVHQGAAAFETKLLRRHIESGRYAQAVMACEGGIFTARQL